MKYKSINLNQGKYVHFLVLKNISLISCFLGLGIGYTLRNYKIYSINWIYPLLTIQIIILYFFSQTPVSSILINPIAEQLTMGQKILQEAWFIY